MVAESYLINANLMFCNFLQDFFLEFFNFFGREHVGFWDKWDQVDARLQSFHELNVNWPQSVATRIDKVKKAVDSIIYNVTPIETGLIVQVLLKID